MTSGPDLCVRGDEAVAAVLTLAEVGEQSGAGKLKNASTGARRNTGTRFSETAYCTKRLDCTLLRLASSECIPN